MSFTKMREELVAKGLIGKDGRLTQKGHDYVGEIKQNYRKNTPPFKFEELNDGEVIDRPIIKWRR